MTSPALSQIRSVVSVAVLTVTGILAVGQTYVVLGLIDSMADSLRVPPSAVAASTTIFGIAYACGFLAAGPLAGRFGAKPVLLAGLVCASTTALAAAAPTSISAELVIRAVQGFVTAAFAPCALVYVAQQFPARLRTVATTALTTGFLASAVVMPLIAGPAAHLWGWRGVFLASGMGLAVCAGVLAVTLTEGAVASVPMSQALLVLPRVIRRGRMIALYLATAAVLGGYVALFTALQLSDSAAVAGFPGGLQGLRIATLPALVLVTVAASFLHGIPARRRAVAGFLLAATSAATVAIQAATAVIAVGVVVFVAAIALTTPALVARIVEVAAPEETAGATAWYGAFMFFGGSIGPVIAASALGGNLTAAACVVVAIALLGAVLVASVNRNLPGCDTACQTRSREVNVVS
ncbi:MFS transporter [Rhodococcus hoagii]|nr:MFS transporter [Prescottella equi]